MPRHYKCTCGGNPSTIYSTAAAAITAALQVHVRVQLIDAVGRLRPHERLQASAAAAETKRGVRALPRHRVQLQLAAKISRV